MTNPWIVIGLAAFFLGIYYLPLGDFIRCVELLCGLWVNRNQPRAARTLNRSRSIDFAYGDG